MQTAEYELKYKSTQDLTTGWYLLDLSPGRETAVVRGCRKGRHHHRHHHQADDVLHQRQLLQ